VGLFRGFLAPFRGAIYVARQRLWKHLLAPFVLNLALGAGSMVAASRFWRKELAEMLSTSPVVGWIAVTIMTGIGGVLLFILLQPLLSAIFCDRLAEVVEKRVRGEAPSSPFLASVGKALLHGLLKLVLYALAFGVGLALTVSTAGLGSLVGLGLGAIFLAYDGFDYPLARRGATFMGKWAYLAKNPGLALGYGLGSYVLYLVPLAFLVAPPFAAAGATLAYLDADARKKPRKMPWGGQPESKPDGKPESKPASKPEAQSSNEKAVPEAHNPIDISAS
jgi:CysZ protein